MKKISIFWFRRDLRLEDNAGLYKALREAPNPVLPLFIFDQKILSRLEDDDDPRVTFIHQSIRALGAALEVHESSLLVKYGEPSNIWQELLSQFEVTAVYTNHDFEPYAIKRDQKVEELLASKEIPFRTFKDHVLFEKDEVLKKDGLPYTVFTPYKRRWLEKLLTRPNKKYVSFYFKPYPCSKYFSKLARIKTQGVPDLRDMGFRESDQIIPSTSVARKVIKNYDQQRDFPALSGTTKLGIHFRFGTISIREKARKAYGLNQTFLSELIWRDFYAQILAHFPHVAEGSFRPKYDRLQWRNDEVEFQAWCDGRTGYPLVDAGMRELNATGFMHNRVRMVTASFLTKHLLIDWRWGEAYFARKLLDFDLASNNGGWQWAAGCGTDAAPYFRIFNPTTQFKKFDSEARYVRKWVPEYDGLEYIVPIVDHKMARERCLSVYKEALG